MPLPGAPISTVVAPYCENDERLPVEVIDATAMMFALV